MWAESVCVLQAKEYIMTSRVVVINVLGKIRLDESTTRRLDDSSNT